MNGYEEVISVVLEQDPCVVVVEGPAGYGNSVFLKRIGQQLDERDPQSCFAVCGSSENVKGWLDVAIKGWLDVAIQEAVRDHPQELAVVAFDNVFHGEWEAKRINEGSRPDFGGLDAILKRVVDSGIHVIWSTRPGIPLPSSQHIVKLNGLDVRQIQHLGRMHDVFLSEDSAREFIEWTGGSIRLATMALQGARRHQWDFEDLMRFETEEWSRIFDPEVMRVRDWLEGRPGQRRALLAIAQGVDMRMDSDVARMMLPLEAEGVIRRLRNGRWSLCTPIYKRVLAPEVFVRLPNEFRLQFAPKSWMMASAVAHRGHYCSIQLTLFSSDPRNAPLHGAIRFRLTPDVEKTVEVEAGVARAIFDVPAPFGPITVYAETPDGRCRLGNAIERTEKSSSRTKRDPPLMPGRKQKKSTKTKRTTRKAKEIIEALLPDFAIDLMNSDDTLTGVMAETNAQPFGFEYGHVESAKWNGDGKDRIDFRVSMSLTGEQREDMGYNGDVINLRVSGIAVRNGTTWEVDSYDIESCETNVDADDEG